MENDAIEKKDITSHRYRIPPEVKEFIFKALNIYESLPILQDKVLLTRARNDLSFSLQEINNNFENNIKEEKKPEVKEDTTVPSDPLKEANYKNALILIKKIINTEIKKSKSDEVKEVLNRVIQKMPSDL
jgi:ribosomal protein RSM22 (predicted rRNA methylase)